MGCEKSEYGVVTASWITLVAHLRLHYQLLFLSPLFMWGVALGGGVISRRTVIGFVAFHVFLYGGVTAYNSYYDRDEGPVGGFRVPPPVTPQLLGFSLAVQAAGLLLALYVGAAFAALYLAIAALSLAYSHPRVRWKAKPIHSLLVVAFGQGTAGFVAGLLAAGSSFTALASPRVALGAAVATLCTVGLYPLTQLYQIDEDRARGDRTFAVAFGAPSSFAFSLTCLATAGICLIALLGAFGALDAAFGALGMLALLAFIARWRARFRAEVNDNFYAVHWIQLVLSLTTLGYVGFRLLRA
jgi:4-hydroxybenzoate polyprenyltransferase